MSDDSTIWPDDTGGSVSPLPDPLPAEWNVRRLEDGDWVSISKEPVVVVAVALYAAFVITDHGQGLWVRLTDLTFKFPPNGPYRLLFGWAEKGQS